MIKATPNMSKSDFAKALKIREEWYQNHPEMKEFQARHDKHKIGYPYDRPWPECTTPHGMGNGLFAYDQVCYGCDPYWEAVHHGWQ